MLVEKVDVVGTQAFEGIFDGSADMLRPAVHAAPFGDVEAKLGGDDHLVADRLQSLAHDCFVLVWAIDLGGIKEDNAAIEGAPDDSDAFGWFEWHAIGLADAHATEADG